MKTYPKKLIVILGPTATGKTRLAVALARKFGGEIISADSRQVYRGMDIGTGKDLAEYGLKTAPRALKGQSGSASRGPKKPSGVPYHLIDIISPKTGFNVAKYQKSAYRAIAEVQKQGKVPFLVGGTGLYIDAVVKGFVFSENNSRSVISTEPLLSSVISTEPQGERRDPLNVVKRDSSITPAGSSRNDIRKELNKLSLPKLLLRLKKIDPKTYGIIDQKNRRRVQRALEIFYESGQKKSEAVISKPDLDVLILGVSFPLEKIYKRIDSRLEARIKEGMIKEVKKLRAQGVSWKRLDEFGLEYRYVSRYLRGILSYEEMLEQLTHAIHHFAKRQMTWFKRGEEIIWIKGVGEAVAEIRKFIKKK